MTRIKQNIKKYKWAYLILLAVAIACAFLLRIKYAALVLCYIGIYSIATSGLDIVWGYTGQISYGHAGFYAIGAYASALLSLKLGLPPILTVFIGGLLAALIGILVAFPAAKLVKHFLALLTLAFGQIVYMFVNSATKITNGSSGIRNIPSISIFGLQFDTNQKMFFFIIAILILTLIVKNNIIKSRTGRAFIAIRENTHAANGIGVNPVKYKVMAFSLSAFFTGIAGGLYAHLVGYISPDTFMSAQTVVFMTILLFGGIGSFYGPLVGSVVIVLLKEAFQSFLSAQELIYAIFILIVLFFLPTGVAGLIDIVKKKISRKKEAKMKTGGIENADA